MSSCIIKYWCALIGLSGAVGSLAQAKKVDLDAVPQIGGQSIYEYDLEATMDKPWRMPGMKWQVPGSVRLTR